MKSYAGKIAGMTLLAALAGVLPLLGQTAPDAAAPPGAPSGERNLIYIQRAGPAPAEGASDFYLFADGEQGMPAVPPPPPPMGLPTGPMISFVSAVGGFGGNTVTGAPYSAEAVTEIEQRLADGNRIVRRTTATIYRDSEGRTRRDQTLGAIGPWVVGGDLPQISSIYDPVESVRYMLDHTHRTARELPASPFAARLAGRVHTAVSSALGREAQVHAGISSALTGDAGSSASGEGASPEGTPIPPFDISIPAAPGIDFRDIAGPASRPEQRSESLGTQLMEGVEAEGTRSISTIPAGAIGNDFAIEIVSERWYSPALQAVVLSLHKDPRMGETTYRLSNIQRTEPSPSLFEVPEGYTVIEPRAFPPPPAPPAP